MSESFTVLDVDFCVIGAGSGGLSVAAGASQLGQSVVLIEKEHMGGDCLNVGCVPSKALLSAAKAAQSARTAAKFGVRTDVSVDYASAMNHVRQAIKAIEPMDSVERYQGFGVTVIKGHAAFTDPKTVVVRDTKITARYFVVATGSRPFIPPIPGLDTVPYLTNETIWNTVKCPAHLIVVGGGPIGLEMAQAHARLGADVTVLEAAKALPKDDPEAAAVVLSSLRAEGIKVIEGARVIEALNNEGSITVRYETDTAPEPATLQGSHILVAAGRRPVVDGLGLDAANVTYSPKGIEVNDRLVTSNRRVFAIGDVIGGYQFTHVAGNHAGIVIKRTLFKMPAKIDTKAIPWVTYTDPELAHVGYTEAAAREKFGNIRLCRWALHENDRAIAEAKTDGFVKVITTPRGKILGATIVGHMAGELIQPWILAISSGLKMSAFANMIAPYPTLGEINKRAAGAFYTPKLFSDGTRRFVRLLSRFF